MRVFQISDSEPGIHNRCEYIFIRAGLADSNDADSYRRPNERPNRLLKLISGCSKRSRCEAREISTSGGVFTDTLERGDRAQPFDRAQDKLRRWAFFNSLLTLALYGGNPCHC